MKKLWHSLKVILLAYLIQYIACFISMILYLVFISNEIINYDVIFKYLIIAITITIIPMIIFILKKYKRKEPKVNYLKLLSMIPLGVGISWFYNMLTINIQEPSELMNLHIIIIILYTVILGPVFEELLFRYVALRKAEEVYSKKIALIIISLAFALLHTGLIGILYAFLVGLILGKIYQRENNILYPIILHISANLASIFVIEYNTIMLVVGIGLIMVGIYFYRRLTN